MIDLYYWPTPNGHKITLFLEEANLPYRLHPVDITHGEQFKPDFLKISPNNKMPAIVDGDLSLFESGAILLYLARKTGQFMPKDLHAEAKVLEWLFWQVGGLGPMSGQAMHFKVMAKEKIPYAIDRYTEEVLRLYGVAEKQLSQHAYLAGNEYSIADMAAYPWFVPHDKLKIDMEKYPSLTKWLKKISERAAVIRAYKIDVKSIT